MRVVWRAVAGAGGLLVALVSVLSVAPAAVSAATLTTWRTDGYGPGNAGFNPVETSVTAGTVRSLDHRWSVVSPVVRSSCSRQAPPVVGNHKVYVSDQGGIGAYHAGTGVRAWSYRFPQPADEWTPKLTVLGSRLFAANSGCLSVSDPDGRLRAFDANTGALLWTALRDAPMDVLVVDKDTVVVAGEDLGPPMVTAYRISDGAQLWSRQARLPRPVSANGRLLLTRYEQPGSDLVDIRTGTVLWSSPATWSVLAAGPAGGPLYAAGPAADLLRINVETGAVVWSVPDAAAQVSVDGPRLYVARGTELVVRDAATGGVLWTRSMPAQLGKPVVAGGVLYVTASGRRIDVLDAVTGAVLDDTLWFEGAVGHPVVANGRLYVTTGRVLDAFTP